MDLRLYASVLWRFRFLALGGVLLAIALAVFSYARVSAGSEQWQSEARLFITQSGFPWGRTVPESSDPSGEEPTVQLEDPSRLTSLAMVYSEFANSDAVHERIFRGGLDGSRLRGSIQAAVVTDASTGGAAPLIGIAATSSSPQMAMALARRTTEAVRNYVITQQSNAGIPSSERVILQVLSRADSAQMVQGPKKTVPMFVFLAVIVLVVGLIFVLENLRPGLRAGTKDEIGSLKRPAADASPAVSGSRQSA